MQSKLLGTKLQVQSLQVGEHGPRQTANQMSESPQTATPFNKSHQTSPNQLFLTTAYIHILFCPHTIEARPIPGPINQAKTMAGAGLFADICPEILKGRQPSLADPPLIFSQYCQPEAHHHVVILFLLLEPRKNRAIQLRFVPTARAGLPCEVAGRLRDQRSTRASALPVMVVAHNALMPQHCEVAVLAADVIHELRAVALCVAGHHLRAFLRFAAGLRHVVHQGRVSNRHSGAAITPAIPVCSA